jgi:hypothetical protein
LQRAFAGRNEMDFWYGSRVLFYISTVHPLVLDTSVGVKAIASIHDWAEVLPNAGWHKETNVEAMGVFWMLFTQDLLSVIELWRCATTTSKQQRSFGTYAFFLVSETANPIENQRISKHTRREIPSYRPGREEEMAVYAPSWLLEEQQNSPKFKAAEPERKEMAVYVPSWLLLLGEQNSPKRKNPLLGAKSFSPKSCF